LGQFSKNYGTFHQKIFQKALKNMVLGSGIRDPGSGKNLFRIPDPGVKKAPDPGSATLDGTVISVSTSGTFWRVKGKPFNISSPRFSRKPKLTGSKVI
jgi:hypothetical protein